TTCCSGSVSPRRRCCPELRLSSTGIARRTGRIARTAAISRSLTGAICSSARPAPARRRTRAAARSMLLHNLMQWMADTEWSVGLHESRYAYSIVESVHVWTLCLFVGFAVFLDLRLMGVTLKRVPVSQITDRLVPWIKAAFVLMVTSGLLLFFAIPLRTYHNVFFRVKAVLLVLAALNAWVFHNGGMY